MSLTTESWQETGQRRQIRTTLHEIQKCRGAGILGKNIRPFGHRCIGERVSIESLSRASCNESRERNKDRELHVEKHRFT